MSVPQLISVETGLRGAIFLSSGLEQNNDASLRASVDHTPEGSILKTYAQSYGEFCRRSTMTPFSFRNQRRFDSEPG